jgi:formate--tetrahydrofolate ligase
VKGEIARRAANLVAHRLAPDRAVRIGHGGAGAEELAQAMVDAAARPAPPRRYLYDLDESLEAKIEAIARPIYAATEIEYSRTARRELERASALGYDKLPICIAKTHLKLVDNGGQGGRPGGSVLPIESVRVDAGAGYVLALSGDIVTMPGLPKEAAAYRIDLSDDGEVVGL